MIKSIIKEFFIILILCLIILAILSILFYDYNPISKVVPSKVAYVTPQSVNEILEEESVEELVDAESRVYTIEGSDLNLYKKSKTYDPSKENPFVASPVDTVDTNANTNTTTQTNNTTGNTQGAAQTTSTTKGNGSK